MNCISAFKREEKGHKARKGGYIPGIIYGKGMEENYSVKFNKNDMIKIIKTSGDRAKLVLMFENEKKYGIIKSIQRNPINPGDIYNIDIQMVSKDEEVRQAVPIMFNGKNLLESKGLLLQVLLTEVDVTAKAAEIPNSFTIDLNNKDNGDVIKAKDIELNADIKLSTEPETVIASVTYAGINS
ncbi:50S ribosomal protein L25 [Haloimpatiens sp. FM7315]|uniref:50S ribosomal protein L25 n=1 Tax=Haloimpatiens sp. FM7315 TaxID=3298609 RepID=UPI0035A2715B